MRLILIACIQLLFWVEVYSDNHLPTYPGYHPTFSCDSCNKQMNKFCCERPKDIWEKDPNKKFCCDFPAEGQGICKGDGERCGKVMVDNKTSQYTMMEKYEHHGKCCDGFICKKDGLAGKCVKGKLLGVNDTCEPGLEQCGPGLSCLSILKQWRWLLNVSDTQKLYQNSSINPNKPPRCMPGKDENESCEKDGDCKPQLTCVKHSHVYIYNKTEEKFSIQDIPKNKTTGKCMGRPVEGHNCMVDADCCVNPKDCELQCVWNVTQFVWYSNDTYRMEMEDILLNKTHGKCFPRKIAIPEFGAGVCLEQPCGSPCTVHKIGNEKWDLKLKGVCNVDKECEENPTKKCPAEGTKYKFDEECCKREFMKVLKDESKTQMCIGLCTPKTLGRIPTVCDDVKQIPDQMCTVEIQTKP